VAKIVSGAQIYGEPDEEDGVMLLMPEAVVEVVSCGFEAKDLEIGPPFYLSQGVRDMVIFDPATLLVLHMPCDVDLVSLDTDDIVLKHEAVRRNRLVYQTDDFGRGTYFSRVVRQFLDFLPPVGKSLRRTSAARRYCALPKQKSAQVAWHRPARAGLRTRGHGHAQRGG